MFPHNSTTGRLASPYASSAPAPAHPAPLNPGLQGLRGVAILLVLLNHLSVPGFGGGFVGVDLFFVISGYLIGGLLLKELTLTGRVDLWTFYARRFRRLLPAFLLLMVAVLCAIPVLYAPFEHAELLSSARASALYAANFWFTSRSTNYFGGHTEANPLLHLWSLAVEEQFYLFLPLLMLVVSRAFRPDVRRAVFWLVLVAGGTSLAACVVVSAIQLPWAFFLTPMRVWEFAAGMALTLASARLSRLPGGLVAALGLLALLALLGATLLFDARLAFPGAWAVIPVAASVALLVVVTHGSQSPVHRLLKSRGLVWLGDCSYSVYLWHWPVIVFAAMTVPRHGAVVTAPLFGVSVLVGFASYRWVELPFKNSLGKGWPARRVVVTGLLACLSLAGAAHLMGKAEVREGQARFQQATEWPAAIKPGCLASYEAVDQPACEYGVPGAAKTLVLFGDSHAMQWFLPLQAVATEQGWRLITLTKAQCPSVDVVVNYQGKNLEYTQCNQWRDAMVERIKALQPSLVLMANSSGYGVDPAQWQAGLSRAVARLQSFGHRVAYVRDTPFPGFDVPTCLARAQWRGLPASSLCSYPQDDAKIWAADLARAEAQALAAAQSSYLDLSAAVCAQPVCETERNGVILFKDRNHISADHAVLLKPQLQAALLRWMETPP